MKVEVDLVRARRLIDPAASYCEGQRYAFGAGIHHPVQSGRLHVPTNTPQRAEHVAAGVSAWVMHGNFARAF